MSATVKRRNDAAAASPDDTNGVRSPEQSVSPLPAAVAAAHAQLPPYTPLQLALDVTPLLVCSLFYAWMLRRGLVVAPVIIFLLQLVGGGYVFFVLLRAEMKPRHWAGSTPTIPAANSSTGGTGSTPSSPSLSPLSAPIGPSPPSLEDAPTPPPLRRRKIKYFDLVAAQSINPFLHPTWKLTSTLERLRISAMAVTLVPFRAVIFFAILLGLWASLKVALYGLPPSEAMSKPLPRFRARVVSFLVRGWASLLVSCAFGFIPGLSLHFENREKKEIDPKIAPIVIANHQSFVDPFLLFTQY